MWLIPVWGLFGAVTATTISTALSVAVLYWINRRAGMELQPGMLWLTIAPAALCGGAWWGTAMLIGIAFASLFSKTLITPQERALLAEFGRHYLATWQEVWARRAAARQAT
jgi:peptidoglycan biosynthesis protein MviN/MurJ (putative lipid II flippase)